MIGGGKYDDPILQSTEADGLLGTPEYLVQASLSRLNPFYRWLWSVMSMFLKNCISSHNCKIGKFRMKIPIFSFFWGLRSCRASPQETGQELLASTLVPSYSLPSRDLKGQSVRENELQPVLGTYLDVSASYIPQNSLNSLARVHLDILTGFLWFYIFP